MAPAVLLAGGTAGLPVLSVYWKSIATYTPLHSILHGETPTKLHWCLWALIYLLDLLCIGIWASWLFCRLLTPDGGTEPDRERGDIMLNGEIIEGRGEWTGEPKSELTLLVRLSEECRCSTLIMASFSAICAWSVLTLRTKNNKQTNSQNLKKLSKPNGWLIRLCSDDNCKWKAKQRTWPPAVQPCDWPDRPPPDVWAAQCELLQGSSQFLQSLVPELQFWHPCNDRQSVHSPVQAST